MLKLEQVKPGLKVRVLWKYGPRLYPGDIVELMGDCYELLNRNTHIKTFVAEYKQSDPTMRRFVSLDYIEIVEDTDSRKCHCPPENFYFNGVGCRCGGS